MYVDNSFSDAVIPYPFCPSSPPSHTHPSIPVPTRASRLAGVRSVPYTMAGFRRKQTWCSYVWVLVCTAAADTPQSTAGCWNQRTGADACGGHAAAPSDLRDWLAWALLVPDGPATTSTQPSCFSSILAATELTRR